MALEEGGRARPDMRRWRRAATSAPLADVVFGAALAASEDANLAAMLSSEAIATPTAGSSMLRTACCESLLSIKLLIALRTFLDIHKMSWPCTLPGYLITWMQWQF